MQEGLPVWVFGCMVACYGYDADVEEVDEELVAGYFLSFLCAPE
jgi:hypothetical protein